MANVESQATRDAFGEVLIELGQEVKNLIVLDADDALATRTFAFSQHFPDRFINVGAAEQNLVGVAAGLAIAGKIPCISTHAIFLCGRAYEQIRNIVGYGNLNVKCVGTHGGITVGHDGPTHFAIEDLTLMRAIPGMRVLAPADGPETKRALRAVIRDIGPAYVRLGRATVPVVTNSVDEFEIGRGTILESGDDVALVACGLMVAAALEARALLHAGGIRASVANFHTIKPLDRKLVRELAESCGAFVVAEEHSIYGGLGSAVAEILCAEYPVPVEFIGVRDCFAESGEPLALLAKYGLTADQIALAARRAIERKKSQ